MRVFVWPCLCLCVCLCICAFVSACLFLSLGMFLFEFFIFVVRFCYALHVNSQNFVLHALSVCALIPEAFISPHCPCLSSSPRRPCIFLSLPVALFPSPITIFL